MEGEPDTGPTPVRLSLTEGQVSFWRPGAEDWSAAALNTPLASGDALYAGDHANLELQIGRRAYVRAGERTQLSLLDQDRGRLQFRIADGQVSFDLRTLPTGLSVEVDTPNSAFTIGRAGYYRVTVEHGSTFFITRRGGQAVVVPLNGQAFSVAPSEELVVEGAEVPSIATYVAPDLDAWDRWNYARTEHLLDAVSARYLPTDVYGAESLDQYGDWRVVADYGPVWVPAGMSPVWAPYSTGRWIWDPFYGWTWVDQAPWGWAPFHYGRWLHLNGHWAWAPGRRVTRLAYSPALVVFFDSHGGGQTSLSWVALSWGEPLIPWWGRRGFIGVPRWAGWGGPHSSHGGPGRVAAPGSFRNAGVTNAVIGLRHEQFGRGPAQAVALPAAALADLTPVRGALPVKPASVSRSPGVATELRPSREVLTRPAVTLHTPPVKPLSPGEPRRDSPAPGAAGSPQVHVLAPPAGKPLPAAPFGAQAGPERSVPSQAPRFEELQRAVAPTAPAHDAIPPRQVAPRTAPQEPARAQPPAPLREQLREPPAAPTRQAPREEPLRQAQPPATVTAPPPPVALRHEERKEERREERREERHEERKAAAPRAPEGAAPERAAETVLPGKPANRLSPRHQAGEAPPR
ncbi:MAG TPA: DUF6600 domain-containing protein [Rhodocyclaceae bacterium]